MYRIIPKPPRYFRRSNRRTKGIMIIDALLAMFFLMLVFVAMISALVTGIQAGRRGREYTAAGLVARRVVENMRSYKAANLLETTYQDATTLGSVPQLSQLNQATVAATVSLWKGRADQVVVVVQWYSVPGKRRLSQTFTTSLCSDGVAE